MRIYADILLIACFYRISTYTIYVRYVYQSPTDDDAADGLPAQYQQCPQEKRSFSKQCKQKETKIAQCDVVPYPLRMELYVCIHNKVVRYLLSLEPKNTGCSIDNNL